MLEGTPKGALLQSKYLEAEGVRVLAADLTLAELSSRLARRGAAAAIPGALDAVVAASHSLLLIEREDAALAGPLLIELRKTDKAASLVDATLLSMARNRNVTLISCDPAFEGQPEVVCESRGQRAGKRRPVA